MYSETWERRSTRWTVDTLASEQKLLSAAEQVNKDPSMLSKQVLNWVQDQAAGLIHNMILDGRADFAPDTSYRDIGPQELESVVAIGKVLGTEMGLDE